MTAPNGPIVFNASTGSDSQASGLGPATAVFGSSASFSASTVTLDGSPDLSGVSAGDCLFLDTTSGRKFFIIASVNDGADTVTVDDAPAGTASGLTWAIGGKRATFADADSQTLFGSSGAKATWIIETETDQTITAAIALAVAGSNSTGWITIRGLTGAKRVLTQSSNTQHWTLTGTFVRFRNLKFQNSNGTKTNAQAFNFSSGTNFMDFDDCIFGDAVNTLEGFSTRSGSQPTVSFTNCEVAYCTGVGIGYMGGGNTTVRIKACSIHDNGSHGVWVRFHFSALCLIQSSVIVDNGGNGIHFENGGSQSAFPAISGNVISGNTGDGIEMTLEANAAMAEIYNNIITNNGAYGIEVPANFDDLKQMEDYNNFGNASSSDGYGGLNTSGALSAGTVGAHDVNIDPQFTDPSTGDFTTAVAGLIDAGFPQSLLWS